MHSLRSGSGEGFEKQEGVDCCEFRSIPLPVCGRCKHHRQGNSHAIAKLDPAAFRATVQAHKDKNIPNLYTSACGEAPIMAAMAAAKSLGATSGVVVSYANSGIHLSVRARVSWDMAQLY